VASKRRAHIRENQQRPLATPIAYSRRSSEEEEIYKGKLREKQGHLMILTLFQRLHWGKIQLTKDEEAEV
jgi:hypothetical protein